MNAATPDDSAEISTIVLEQADRLFSESVTGAVLQAADRGEWPDGLWGAIDEAGLPFALVPEAAGGVGLPVADGMRLIRRAAYHSLPLPLAETMLAWRLWTEVGGAPGSGVVTIAPPGPGCTATIRTAPRGYVLSGRAQDVPWGGVSDHVLVHATAENGSAFRVLVGRGTAQAVPRRNLAFEPRDGLVFEEVALAAEAVRPAAELSADAVLVHGALVRVQQLVGAMQRCLDHAVRYAGERQQFGRPIGKFQAVQHMLAVAAGQVAVATAAADRSLDAVGKPALGFSVAIAKARCGEAAGQVAGIAHQVHAAMGFTQEHPLHYATRRLWSWREEFGAEAFWQERIGRAVCARGGEALWDLLLEG